MECAAGRERLGGMEMRGGGMRGRGVGGTSVRGRGMEREVCRRETCGKEGQEGEIVPPITGRKVMWQLFPEKYRRIVTMKAEFSSLT